MDYAYYNNLSFYQKSLYRKCHKLHNALYLKVFEILKQKYQHIFSIVDIWKSVMRKHSVCEMHMVNTM